MDLNTLYHRTVETWVDRVNAVGPDAWEWPTPCREWTVRDLVNHVTGEDLWTVPLLGGATLEEVGDRFDGDLLGEDPIGTALAAAMGATTAVAERLPDGGTVHLSYGQERAAEYVHQLAADHLVHAWDLAVATSGDPRLDPHLVTEVAAWFAGRAGRLPSRRASSRPPRGLRRRAGPVAGRPSVATRLGAQPRVPREVLRRVRPRRRQAAIMALMSDDCPLRVHLAGPGRRARRPGRRGHRSGLAGDLRRHPRAVVHRGGDVRVPGTGACCAGASPGWTTPAPGPRPRRRRASVPRRPGDREAVLRQGLSARHARTQHARTLPGALCSPHAHPRHHPLRHGHRRRSPAHPRRLTLRHRLADGLRQRPGRLVRRRPADQPAQR